MRVNNPFTLNQSSHALSSRLAKFLFIAIFVVVPMVVFWVLWGQFNVLHSNWLVGYNGNFALNQFQNELNINAPLDFVDDNGEAVQWTAIVTWNSDLNGFFSKYNVHNTSAAIKILNQAAQYYGMQNWGVGIIASWKIFVIMLADLLVSIILLQLGIFFTKWFFYDSYPMLIAVWATMFVLVVCSLLDYGAWWSYLVVITSLITTLLVFLFLFVQIINAILSRTNLGNYYYETLLKSNKKENSKTSGSSVEAYKKYKAKKTKTITFEKD